MLKIFRASCFLVIVVLLLNQFIFNSVDNGVAKKLVGVIMIIFSGDLGDPDTAVLNRKQYGRIRVLTAGTKEISESYNSRFLSLLVAALVSVFAVIGIVNR